MTKVKERNLSNITGLSEVAFKGIMYKNESVLRAVLSEVLEENIGIIKYLNAELSVTRFLEKWKKVRFIFRR